MESLTVHVDSKEKLKALKIILKAMQIDYEKAKSPYNPEFVAKILQGDEDFKNGRSIRVTLDDIWK